MGREKDSLPVKPKSLQGFNPLQFQPDWKAQGRRTRITFAEHTFRDVEKALYEKGVAKVQFMTAVDDSRKTLETLIAFPPGTAIARYLEPRLEEIRKAMEDTQVELVEATDVRMNPGLSEQEKFAKLSQIFDGYTSEEIDVQIKDDLMEIAAQSETDFRPDIPVYSMTGDEAMQYLQRLLEHIQRKVKNLKSTHFRKWPVLKEGILMPASEFDQWDEQVESVLPRQKYFGRNTAFDMDNLADRVVLANAKILENLGEDPNTFAKNIPDLFEAKDWNTEKEIFEGKSDAKTSERSHKGLRKKRGLIKKQKEMAKVDVVDMVKEVEINKEKLRSIKQKRSKERRKKSKRSSSSDSFSSSSSSESSSDSPDEDAVVNLMYLMIKKNFSRQRRKRGKY